MRRSAASRARSGRVLLAIFMLAMYLYTCIVAIEEYSMMKLQLHTKQQSRSEQTRARRRALDDIDKGDTDFVSGEFALSESYLGVGYGTHYAEMYLGIPAQRASVIVDTGSHFTALPCITCNDCGKHTDPPYNVSKSTTATYLACNDFDSCRSCEQERCYVNQNYVEGSMWQAVMIDELIWLGGLASLSDEVEGVMKTFGFRFPVGCQTKETGLFVTQQENGIMGLGRHHSTVMSYMLKAGRVKHDIFTLCFAGDGGELTFGGVDYSHHTSGVSYTPLLNEHSVTYLVHVRDILVNGVSLGIDEKTINSGKGVIVDSGTTDTFFDAGGNRRFMKAFRHAAGGRDYSEKVMKLSQDELARLPVISIVLSGMKGDGSDDIQLDVPASKYLISSHDGVSYYGNLHFSERSGGVLGASVMIGLDVIFDAENQRVGFAESHCGKAHVNTISESPDTVDPFISKTAAPNASIAIGETNGSNVSSSNSLAVVLMNPTATPVPDNATVGSIDPTTSSSADVTTQRESPNFDVSTAEAILILLVSVALGVIVWTKWRMRTWSRIPNYTSRAHMETILHSNETTSQPLSSGAEESLLSPRSRAAKIIQSSKFINGSSEEEDDDDDE
ncbi:unnamed protein product [Peronospora belbahrii]|uniref:Peptidase A1 domain-containing protein n=1 Tax=Peronospora belbahrii TaxID=622444 RepID=A0AAU9L6I3_9STRA|nr:unnamed protein product [Peronospora belbahrii]CAH0522232.1 unnamed protein product [Peronospora belbahrii]